MVTSHDPLVSTRPKHDFVYLTLCFLVLCTGLIAVRSTVMNANLTAVYQIVFLVIYAFYLKPSSDFPQRGPRQSDPLCPRDYLGAERYDIPHLVAARHGIGAIRTDAVQPDHISRDVLFLFEGFS